MMAIYHCPPLHSQILRERGVLPVVKGFIFIINVSILVLPSLRSTPFLMAGGVHVMVDTGIWR